MKTFQVNDQIQVVQNDGSAKDGTIVSITPSKRMKTDYWWRESEEVQNEMKTFANVKWEGSDSEEKVDMDDLDPRDSDMERQYRNTVREVMPQIQSKVDEAGAALDEAVALAEKHGIPFRASISPLSQSYRPGSIDPDLSESFINDVTEAGGEYEGWQHSAVCY